MVTDKDKVWFSLNKADFGKNNLKKDVLRKSTTAEVTKQLSFNEFCNEIYNKGAVTRLKIDMCFNYVCVHVCVQVW